MEEETSSLMCANNLIARKMVACKQSELFVELCNMSVLKMKTFLLIFYFKCNKFWKLETFKLYFQIIQQLVI